MKNFLLTISMLVAVSINAQIVNCSELFISEYIEGSGNNKALEIYNPTQNNIDLNSYIIIRYSNGSNSANASNAVQLTGTIFPNDVHVGVIEKLNPAGTGQDIQVDPVLQLKADAFYCADYNVSNAWYWNGNDAIVLAKGNINDIPNAIIIDVFGKVGEDPIGGWTNDASTGYTSSGYSWTQDHTLIRKETVLSGDVNPTNSFDPSLEWDSIPEDSWNYLGAHDCDCSGTTLLVETEANYNIFPNPVNRGELVSISSSMDIKNIIVTNMLGKQISFNNSIKTGSFSKGVYIVDVKFINGKHISNILFVQ